MRHEMLCGITRDQILNAIAVRSCWPGKLTGLCRVFETANPSDGEGNDWYTLIPHVLRVFGGARGVVYFGPDTDEGEAARSFMLAFMLTLSEDEDSAR